MSKKKEDLVRVQLGFTVESRFFKEVEMTREEYESWIAKLDDAPRGQIGRVHFDLFEHAGFDLADPTDAEDPELDTIWLSE